MLRNFPSLAGTGRLYPVCQQQLVLFFLPGSERGSHLPGCAFRRGGHGPAPVVDGSENGFNGISDPTDAFAGSLGWGPGTAGTSLKSVAAAASMMEWADENAAANRSSDALNDSLSQWFDSLEQVDQENFAEAWPLIEESAQRILDDPKAVQGELSDAGVQETPSCSEEDWSAVAGALNAIVPAPQQ